MPWKNYFISCSNVLNKGDEKKSIIVISSPSQIFLIVEMVVLLFRPLTMLLSVDWVMPHIVDNLLTVIPLELHKSKIRNFTASPIDI